MNKINLINSEKLKTEKINILKSENNIKDFYEKVNIFIGPPGNPKDDFKAMESFFSQKGAHIICGGTTAEVASRFLGKPIISSLEYEDDDIPPISKLESVELVTEGVITLSQAVKNIQNLKIESRLQKDKNCKDKNSKDKKDGASILYRILINAVEVTIYFGRGVNPNHQKADFPYNFMVKSNLISTLVSELKTLGKKVTLNCF